jgi:glycosyltransferase involved in cell wall biosynthesis
MQRSPPVSICLVTYNRAELLPGTLDTLLGQTFGDYELIISDDCSTDDTQTVGRAYAARDKRVRYLRQATNLGMPGNMNACLQAATGEYLANLHDGDLYRPDLIARCKAALDRYPTAGFVFNAYYVRGNPAHPDRSRGISKHDRVFRENFLPLIEKKTFAKRMLSRWDSCVVGTVLARREAYEQVGWFDSTFGEFSDVDMWMRIAREFDVAYVNDPLMELMPLDPSRWYAFVHWRVDFWILGMHTANLARCSGLLPELTQSLARQYQRRRLALLLDHMLACFRHQRWDRVREGLAIWRDADDVVLRALGTALGRPQDAPDWYTPEYWRMAGLPVALLEQERVPGA